MNQSSVLDSVFSALGDPTRRQIVERLTRGRLTISEVTNGFPMSQPALSKHVKILEQSGLVHREISGRVHYLELSTEAMQAASTWLEKQTKFWNAVLDRLDAYLKASAKKERKKK